MILFADLVVEKGRRGANCGSSVQAEAGVCTRFVPGSLAADRAESVKSSW